jgi:hypothetical protein
VKQLRKPFQHCHQETVIECIAAQFRIRLNVRCAAKLNSRCSGSEKQMYDFCTRATELEVLLL